MWATVKFGNRSNVYHFQIPDPIPFGFAWKLTMECRGYFDDSDGTIHNPATGSIAMTFIKDVVYEFRTRKLSGSSCSEYINAKVTNSELSRGSSIDVLQRKCDYFSQVYCGSGTYVASKRIQQLVDSEIDLLEVAKCIRRWERSSCEFTGERDQYLHSLFSMMTDMAGETFSSTFAPQQASSGFISLICHIKRMRSFDVQVVQTVIGFEANANMSSVRQCFPELLAVCGKTCIEFHQHLGLSRENSVTLAVAMAGSKIQFLAVYLMRDCFPVLVELSPELNVFGSFNEQEQVAQWCLRFVSFSKDTADKLRKLPAPGKSLLSLMADFNVSGHFAKPVRNLQQQEGAASLSQCPPWYLMRLNQIMRMYERIRVSCKKAVPKINPYSVILFPEGVLHLPADCKDLCVEAEALRLLLIHQCGRDGFYSSELLNRPLILFQRLLSNQGWSINKPPTPALSEAYVTQLRVAVNVLNAARIAHLDLHPGNIMWRHAPTKNDAERVELRVIDFDYAVLFGRVIPEELVQSVVSKRDRRYPFKAGDEEIEQIACEFHNNYFLEGVTGWVLSTCSEDFVEFMER